jgi:hypothetical protein
MSVLTLEIEDKEIGSFKKIIKDLKYVQIIGESDEDTDEEIIANVTSGVEDLKLILAGKKQSKPARDLLKELRNGL